jgi:hypothetical protein
VGAPGGSSWGAGPGLAHGGDDGGAGRWGRAVVVLAVVVLTLAGLVPAVEGAPAEDTASLSTAGPATSAPATSAPATSLPAPPPAPAAQVGAALSAAAPPAAHGAATPPVVPTDGAVPAPPEEELGGPDDLFTPQFAGGPWFRAATRYDQNFPDPHVVRAGDVYWAYGTSTGGPTLPAMWSTDLKTWTARDAYSPNPYNSDRFFNDAHPRPPAWSLGGGVVGGHHAQWGPGVGQIAGRWLAYTSWEVIPGRRCLSVAVADDPAGPFVDSSTAPLHCDADPAGSIDPVPFVDRDGVPYLLWKSEGSWGLPTRLWSRRLTADGRSFAPGTLPRLLLQTELGWEEPIIENPSMAYSGGAYWLLYSANDWASPNYSMGVARCEGPMGPCARTRNTPLFPNRADAQGAGGGALFTDATGRLRIAYHAWNPPYSSYPNYPACLPSSCTSRGQRFLHVDGVVAAGGTLTVDPVGNVEAAYASGSGITVSGWVLDPSDPAPTDVHVYVNGRGVAARADGPRPDVAAGYPGLGAAHGFSVQVSADAGPQEVCVFGINTGAGGHNLLGCRTVVVAGGPPIGNLEAVSAEPGSVALSGWALDPDTAAPIDVHVYVNGRGVAARADERRPDVGAAYPAHGAGHGYSLRLAAGAGSQQVCAYGINVGAGGHSLLGCRTVVVPSGPPIGTIESGVGEPGVVRVSGWAIDADTAAPIDVHVYVDGVGVGARADLRRADVGAVFPAYGSNHGYSVRVAASPGPHQVCVYAINVGAGGHTLLGCPTVVVPSGAPIGSVEAAGGERGAVRVSGWVLDPDTAAPADVHVYVDGVGVAARADGVRPDVGAVFRGYGPNHGYAVRVPAAAGVRQVCVYGINVGAGGHTLLGCRSVLVPA